MSNKHLQIKVRAFLTGFMVAMVTYYAIKITIIIGWLMAGCLCDTDIVALLDREVVLFGQSIADGKVLETVASHLNQSTQSVVYNVIKYLHI